MDKITQLLDMIEHPEKYSDEKLEKKHGYKVSNKDIIEFNRIVAQNLIGFGIIDTYDYLVDHAFFTADGLHYKAETYKMIYKVLSDAILL